MNTRAEGTVAPLSHLLLTQSVLLLATLGHSRASILALFIFLLLLFLGLLRNISLTALKSGGCLSTTGVLQKWKFS